MANLDKDLYKPVKQQFAFQYEKVNVHKKKMWQRVLHKFYKKKKIQFHSLLDYHNTDPYNFLQQKKKALSESSCLYAGLWVACFLFLGALDSGFSFSYQPPVAQEKLDTQQLILNQANNAAINLLTYEATSPEYIGYSAPLFYQDGFSRWEQYAKYNSLVGTQLSNSQNFLPEINTSTITSITGKHGMTYYHTLTPIKVHYIANNKEVTIEKQLILTLVENPEKHNEFLIDDAKIREK